MSTGQEFKVGMFLIAVREPKYVASQGFLGSEILERRNFRESPWKVVAVDGQIVVLEEVYGFSLGARRMVNLADEYTFVEVKPELIAALTKNEVPA